MGLKKEKNNKLDTFPEMIKSFFTPVILVVLILEEEIDKILLLLV